MGQARLGRATTRERARIALAGDNETDRPAEGEASMGLSDSFKKMMKDPKNQERLSQLGKMAQEKAKDPKTRAQLEKALEKAKRTGKKK